MPEHQALDEDTLIRRYFAPLATHPGALGLADDAATFPVPAGREIVLTADALVSGVHFFAEDPPDLVARKALRVNVSDLVAKGAVPEGYLLTLGLGDGWTADWVAGFAQGLAEDGARFAVALLGGDTVRTNGPSFISVAALGTVPAGEARRRTAARPGHLLYATGTIGDAALGLLLRRRPDAAAAWGLSDRERTHLLDRYLLPQPNPAAAPLVLRFAGAAMDVSDGLAIDAGRLCRASGVSASIDVERVPLSDAARRAVAVDAALLETAITGGDDYEVLFTAESGDAGALEQAFATAGIALARIGAIGPPREPVLEILSGGRPMALARLGFRHF